MYCTNCGSQLPDGSKFCTSCGAAQANASAPASPSAGHVPNAAPVAPNAQPAMQQPQYAPPQGQVQYAQQPAYQQPAATGPWYGKTWVIILFLLFFWPVGLVFMWMKTCTWQRYAKIIVTVAIGLIVVINAVSVFGMFGALMYGGYYYL